MCAAVFYLVGYLGNTLVKGAQYKGPVFESMATGKMSDVKVTGYTGDIVEELVSISKLNKYGVNYKGLTWFDIEDEENPGTKVLFGWYQWDGETDPIDCNEDPLVAGEALWVNADDAAVGFAFQNAGQVAIDGVAVTLVKGAQYLASATPRDAIFGEISVSGYIGDIVEELVSVSKLDKYGVNYKGLTWFDIEDEENPGTKLLYGWYQWDGENDPEDCNTDELAPGDGLWVNADDAAVGWSIIFPKAIAD